MASSYLLTLSSTFPRLNVLPKPSFLSTLKPLITLNPPNLNRISTHSSASQLNSAQPQIPRNRFDDDLIVLGIETSCDDTAAAVVRGNGEILSQVISSQAELLAQYGGVAPKMSEEAHLRVIDQVVQEALDKANMSEKDPSAVAVTIGPGLSLCLRVSCNSLYVRVDDIVHKENDEFIATDTGGEGGFDSHLIVARRGGLQ